MDKIDILSMEIDLKLRKCENTYQQCEKALDYLQDKIENNPDVVTDSEQVQMIKSLKESAVTFKKAISIYRKAFEQNVVSEKDAELFKATVDDKLINQIENYKNLIVIYISYYDMNLDDFE